MGYRASEQPLEGQELPQEPLPASRRRGWTHGQRATLLTFEGSTAISGAGSAQRAALAEAVNRAYMTRLRSRRLKALRCPIPAPVRVAVIGSGPAGYTAAIYAARALLAPVLISGMEPGGQLTITTDVENYPGFADVIQGPWLMEQMRAQAEHVGTEILNDLVVEADLSKRPYLLKLDSGAEILAETVIISTGAQARWLGLESEEKYRGFGVSALRYVRRLLLSRKARGGRRRRQHGGGGGAVPDHLRRPGDAGSPARRVAR